MSSTNCLRAVYSSPQPLSQTFQHQLSSPSVSSHTSPPDPVQSKVAYLGELRQLVPKLQDEINVFLTERMEEDKKAAEAQGRKESDNETKEEQNYGEENVEEET